MSRTITGGLDYTSKDYEAFKQEMIRNLQIKLPEYTDIRETDAGIVILELLAQGLDIISYYQDSIANECFPDTAQMRDSIMRWSNMFGYIPRFSNPAQFKQIFTLTRAMEEPFFIPKGTVVRTEFSDNGDTEDEVAFETMDDLTIPAGKLGNEVGSTGEYLYTVDIIEGRMIDEEIGDGTGLPSQSYRLSSIPVYIDSLIIAVDGGLGFQNWERVDNFIDSNPFSQHYVVSVDEDDIVTITFGDGVFGSIPPVGTSNITATYRNGGGERGNVGAGVINTVDNPVAGIWSTKNPDVPYIYGVENEGNESIKQSMITAWRTKWGALTEDDFADVVLEEFNEVLDAVSVTDTTNPDDLHIYILMRNLKPITDIVKTQILELFDNNYGGRKILGADVIDVLNYTAKHITLVATLRVYTGYDYNRIQMELTDKIKNYFDLGNYPFNTECVLDEFADLMTDGIDGIRSFRFTTPADDIIIPEKNEILVLDKITITAKE